MKGLDNKYTLDKADLVQTIIIVAGFAVSAITVTGVTTSALMNKGEAIAGCIAQSDSFTSGNNSKQNCQALDEEATIKTNNTIVDNFGTASEKTYATEQAKHVDLQKKDLNAFGKLVEEFYKENGHYPKNRTETQSLGFTPNPDAYPDYFRWNFDYCPSLDGSGYIVVSLTQNEAKDTKTVSYVSSNNKTARSYYANPEKEGDKADKNGQPISGGLSYCYSGVPNSAADKVGLKNIGDVTDFGDNKYYVTKGGWSMVYPET